MISAQAKTKAIDNKLQAGVLAEVPAFARYVFFDLKPSQSKRIDTQNALADWFPKHGVDDLVLGIGTGTARIFGHEIEKLRNFQPSQWQMNLVIPRAPAALSCVGSEMAMGRV